MKISSNLFLDYENISMSKISVDILAEAGFKAIDFPLEHGGKAGIEEAYAIEMASYIKSKGMEIGQVHLPFDDDEYTLSRDDSYEAFERELLPIIIEQIAISAKIGCKLAVCHLISKETPEETVAFNKQFIDALRPIVRATGVQIALENLFTLKQVSGQYKIVDGFIGSAEEMLFYADYGKEDGFGICLDTGHALLLGYDPVKLIRAFGSKLIALHVNNNPGYPHGDDLHMLPGTLLWREQTDWYEISAALKEVGYKGTYNLELELPYIDIATERLLSPKDYLGYYMYAATIARHYAELVENY